MRQVSLDQPEGSIGLSDLFTNLSIDSTIHGSDDSTVSGPSPLSPRSVQQSVLDDSAVQEVKLSPIPIEEQLDLLSSTSSMQQERWRNHAIYEAKCRGQKAGSPQSPSEFASQVEHQYLLHSGHIFSTLCPAFEALHQFVQTFQNYCADNGCSGRRKLGKDVDEFIKTLDWREKDRQLGKQMLIVAIVFRDDSGLLGSAIALTILSQCKLAKGWQDWKYIQTLKKPIYEFMDEFQALEPFQFQPSEKHLVLHKMKVYQRMEDGSENPDLKVEDHPYKLMERKAW